MSLLFGAAPVQQRAWGIIPPIPPNSQAAGSSFARVDLSRAEASLQKVAVWACVSLIRTIAEILPIQCFLGTDQDKREVDLPRYLQDLSGDGFGLPDWCSQVVYSGMLRGNAIGVVASRADNGGPTQVVLQHPDLVTVRRSLGAAESTSVGAPEWRVNGTVVPTADIWHHRINPVPGEILGLSPIAMHALTVGVGIAALRFGAQWFEDGAHPGGVLTYEKDLTSGKAETAKQRFMQALRGKREPVVLGNGWKFDAIQISPNESQFLETNNYTGAECCRIFGPAFAEVFGYDVGGNFTYANVEQRSIDLLTYAADPWLVRLERMLTDLCSSQRYIKFNRGALLRSDLLTRYQAHQIALQNQFMVPNEVRELEDMGPLPGGNKVIEKAPTPTVKVDNNP
ncbi:MAG: phage portal protein [Pseudonocardiaceae bacterium]